MTFDNVLAASGYRMPIPRSPAMSFVSKENKPVSAVEEERVPFPYDYLKAILDEDELEEQRQKFLKNVRKKQFNHVYASEPPKGKK